MVDPVWDLPRLFSMFTKSKVPTEAHVAFFEQRAKQLAQAHGAQACIKATCLMVFDPTRSLSVTGYPTENVHYHWFSWHLSAGCCLEHAEQCLNHLRRKRPTSTHHLVVSSSDGFLEIIFLESELALTCPK